VANQVKLAFRSWKGPGEKSKGGKTGFCEEKKKTPAKEAGSPKTERKRWRARGTINPFPPELKKAGRVQAGLEWSTENEMT